MKGGEWLLTLGALAIFITMLVPLNTFIVDMLLVFSFLSALIILFVSMQTPRPLGFSTFPSILLMITLFRLVLNVATTRLILLNGHTGSAAAGHMVESFGKFVVGGSYMVGIIIFAILVIINFVVITKGTGRIAEVAARFMLDAMPGKQMSIDADLNAGLISERAARQRRAAISREADFYGAMDGASKFVRGEAIAAIIMILLNIVGGLVIGIFQRGLTLTSAAQKYTLLTVGEGLVAQIPALVVSTAAGVIVTRAASSSNLGADIMKQIWMHPKALLAAAGLIALFGLMPGLPHVAPLMLATATGLLGLLALQAQKEAGAVLEEDFLDEPGVRRKEGLPEEKKEDEGAGTGAGAGKEGLSDEKQEAVVPLDLMEINVGYGLIPLVDETQGGELLKRITAIRTQLAEELGFIVPLIHIRDNLQVKPTEYLIMIHGTEVARGELLLSHQLAMNPTGADTGIPGIPTKEPCFGLDALWIAEADKDRAQVAGMTVVDLPSVIATHLTEIIRGHAHELVGRQETQALLDRFKKRAPKVVEELIPGLMTLGAVAKVLQNLLRERIPIRDLRTILETLADYAPMVKDVDQLTEYVRKGLQRTITRQYQASDRTLPVIGIDPATDQKMAASIQQTGQGALLGLDPQTTQMILVKIRQAVETMAAKGHLPVILCSPMVRAPLRRLIERFFPAVAVISSNEIVPQTQIQLIDTVKVSDADRVG